MTLFRGMRPDPNDGLPINENSAGGLGARPKNGDEGDIPVVAGRVFPETGGMSTATDAMALPPYRRPKAFDGINDKFRIYSLEEEFLAVGLIARQDAPKDRPSHRCVEPTEESDFDTYVSNLRSTRANWSPL